MAAAASISSSTPQAPSSSLSQDRSLHLESGQDTVSPRHPSRPSFLWEPLVEAKIRPEAADSRHLEASSSTSAAALSTASPSRLSVPVRDTRQVLQALSYPQSGETRRQPGASPEEASTSNRAVGPAGKLAFSSPTKSGRRKQQQSPVLMLKAQRWPPSAHVAEGGSVPNWVQSITDQVANVQGNKQVAFDGRTAISSGSPFLPLYTPTPRPMPGSNNDSALIILLPLLVLLSTLLLVLLLFLVLLIVIRRRARIALLNNDGPLDVGREEELEGTGGLDGLEERWLETVDEPTRRGYTRAKDWLLSHPPSSAGSEMTMSQLLSIQEKGVSAWSFEPDYEANSSCYVEARTEITFLADGQGMAPQEGGGCSVQSNLPLPKLNEVYYWEAKIFTKPETTTISVGLSTKPYPSFRLPGWSKYSVGFFSSDGFKCHNYPFAAQSYGPEFVQGDVIGVGYRPRTGTVFFTRNGKKLEDAFVGLNRHSVFPTIGANGPAEVHVNLGQAAFVVIEANVKKWGLAPMTGTLGPPPAYGQERGSILIEAAGQSSTWGRTTPPPPPSPLANESGASQGLQIPYRHGRRRRQRNHEAGRSRERINANSHQAGVMADQEAAERQREEEDPTLGRERRPSTSSSISEAPLNPPTPGHLDISLHSLRSSHRMGGSNESLSSGEANSSRSSNTLRIQTHTPPAGDTVPDTGSYFPPTPTRRLEIRDGPQAVTRAISPPPYSERTSSTLTAHTLHSSGSSSPSPSGSLGGTSESGHRARRTSGRTHRFAQNVFASLGDGDERVPSLNAANLHRGRQVDLESASASARPGQPQRNESEIEYERAASGSRERSSSASVHGQNRPNTWGEALAGWWFSNPSRG